MATQVRWTDGEVARLRRHLDAAYAEHPDNACTAVAKVAREWGVSSAHIREVLARADRADHAASAMKAADTRPEQADIYSQERRAITERLETGLHPHAPWRDPREVSAGLTHRSDNTPWAHTLAGACVWLRKNTLGQHDVSGDLLWCIVMRERCEAESQCVAIALKHAWLDMHAGVAKLGRTPAGLAAIEEAAAILVAQCVTGARTKRKIPVQWKQWHKMQESGERMLWSLADRASRRAVAALR